MSTQRSIWLASASAAAAMVCMAAPAQAQAQTYQVDIPSQSMGDALRTFGRQTHQQVVFSGGAVRGMRSVAVKGNLTAREALQRLIGGAGLTVETGVGGVFMVKPGAQDRVGNGPAADEAASDEERGKSEILVIGSRSQNVDIKRTENDPQPYVVIGQEEIRRSQSNNVEELLRKRLPMNTQSQIPSQSENAIASTRSQIDLRGLGTSQTLILIDGRRAPRVASQGFQPDQADINGIPLAAIERVEILPSTAGGIYGGGAVGGVINIIRKRDYNGIDLQASYDTPFRGGGELYRIDLVGGLSFNGGSTQISFSASHSKSNPFYASDNDLGLRGRALYDMNDPSHRVNWAGSTANIRSQNGSNLVLDNGTALNSNRTSVPLGYSGLGSDGGAALAANAGHFNIALTDNELGKRQVLLNTPTVSSANINLRQDVSSRVNIFADFTISQNKGESTFGNAGVVSLDADSPNNPFQQAITVRYPLVGLPSVTQSVTSMVMDLTGGFVAKLGGNWSMSAEYQWSRSRQSQTSPQITFNPAFDLEGDIISGKLPILTDSNQYPIGFAKYFTITRDVKLPGVDLGTSSNIERHATARISGPIMMLGGGPLNFTGLIEQRREAMDPFRFLSGSNLTLYPDRSQSVTSAYAELNAPIVSTRNGMPLLRSLELQGAIRFDRYRTKSASTLSVPLGQPEPEPERFTNKASATSVTAAILWSPIRDLNLRASYATGFLAPSITQLAPFMQNITFLIFQDPKRGGEPLGTHGPFTLISDGNQNLNPEKSKSFSLGVIFTPSFLPGARFSADYVNIKKTSEITQPSDTFILANEANYPDRVIRGPSLGDGLPGPITSLDLSRINVQKSKVEAFDFRGDYELSLRQAGSLHLYALASYQPIAEQQALPGIASVNRVGYRDGVLKWRGNAGLDWTWRGLTVGWNAQYYSSYDIRTSDNPTGTTDVIRNGRARVPSQIYNDIFLTYELGKLNSRMLRETRISLGIVNILDKKPPVIADFTLYGYSKYGDPRLRRLTMSIRKSF